MTKLGGMYTELAKEAYKPVEKMIQQSPFQAAFAQR
jgi:hypothetical protein